MEVATPIDPDDYLVDPKNDSAFKMLFANCCRTEVLASLITAVRHDSPPVTELQIVDPLLSPERYKGRAVVLDVLAADAVGNHFNVEMQVRRQQEWGDRIAFYLARMFGNQANVGQRYRDLQVCTSISLLDFDLFLLPFQQGCADPNARQTPLFRAGKDSADAVGGIRN